MPAILDLCQNKGIGIGTPGRRMPVCQGIRQPFGYNRFFLFIAPLLTV